MAPCDMFCISISTGTTTATPASTSVPSLARNQVSISPVDDWASIISILGQLMRARVGAIGASSMARTRASGARGVAVPPVPLEWLLMFCSPAARAAASLSSGA